MREEKGREDYLPPRRVAWVLSSLFGIGAFLRLYLRLIYAPTGRGRHMGVPVEM